MMIRILIDNILRSDSAVTPAILHTAVYELKNIGLRMRGFVNDMGPCNMWILLKLGRVQNKTQFQNTNVPEISIWAFCDVPHALKFLRNDLLDSGFEICE